MTRNSILSGVGGVMQEPALSFANDILGMLFAKPNNWRFNAKVLGNITNVAFTTVQSQQDYVLSGATAQVTGKGVIPINSVNSATAGFQVSGTTATITTADSGPHGFAQGDTVILLGMSQANANIQTVITLVPSPTSFQCVSAGFSGLLNDGGQGITDIQWLTHVVQQDWSSSATVKPVHDLEVVFSLPVESIIQNPYKLSFLIENPTIGNVTMRVWPVPSSQIWGHIINYQAKPVLITDLGQTWTPWPDELAFVLRGMMKEMAMSSAEDARQFLEKQMGDQRILMALDIKQQEARHEAFFPDLPVLRGG